MTNCLLDSSDEETVRTSNNVLIPRKSLEKVEKKDNTFYLAKVIYTNVDKQIQFKRM